MEQRSQTLLVRDREHKVTVVQTLWPEVDKKLTKDLLKYRKLLTSMIIGVVTGHCAVGVDLKRWGKTNDNFCRECYEEEETISHLLCHYPALQSKRRRIMGHSFLTELVEVAAKVNELPYLRSVNEP
ncbi:hypothetical protein TSAR_008087 [Trichomalopsis sarcophagae]|uniref:Reverse transcriptase zinc-binding domain-containing protein n=1 Tax=Trichomalopsis sarcophagae TaxID=543379 RepID=A0A232FNE0_9HYME|nr:hypothetical protein TSAR_008087 [Trichomalopsis sarcophagae]